jgi:hypothetical protein
MGHAARYRTKSSFDFILIGKDTIMCQTIPCHLNENFKDRSLPPGGLSALEKISLSSANRQILDSSNQTCAGTVVWRNRKSAEAHDLLALSEIACRFKIEYLDLRESLRALAVMRVPTPCLPNSEGNLHIAPFTRIGLTYSEEALRLPMPGYAFVEIIHPLNVWHANVSSEGPQVLCLGAQLPAGIQVKDIILMTYGAISMQTVMIDERDAAGVLNPDAARWWQQNTHRIPLSKEAFIDNPKLNAST